MKFLKTLQEDGMFGVAAKIENSIRNQREYNTLRRELKQKGLTDYQIDMVRDSVPRKLVNSDGTWQNKYCLGDNHRPQEDYAHEIEAIKNLHKRGFIWTGRYQEYWFLTKHGLNVRNDLEYHNPTEERKPVVVATCKNGEVTSHPSWIDRQTDINIGRDGLLLTCSKITWVVMNHAAIRAQKQQAFLDDFSRSQEDIDKSLAEISTSEQRVARRLIEEGAPPSAKSMWTEAQQREQNDRYWISGGTAFWLNPRGVLADPTPAPDWWSPPADYESLTQKHLAARQEVDVVALSLLAPQDRGTSRPAWLARHDGTGVVYGLHTQAEVDAFIGARKFEGVGFTVSMYAGEHSGPAYHELLKIYQGQDGVVPALIEDIAAKHDEKYREMVLDELLAELDSMGSDSKDDYEDWLDLYEVKTEKIMKIRTGSHRRAVAVQTGKDGNHYNVELNGTVRGFASKLEADTFLGEQRTLAVQKQKDREDAAQRVAQIKNSPKDAAVRK